MKALAVPPLDRQGQRLSEGEITRAFGGAEETVGGDFDPENCTIPGACELGVKDDCPHFSPFHGSGTVVHGVEQNASLPGEGRHEKVGQGLHLNGACVLVPNQRLEVGPRFPADEHGFERHALDHEHETRLEHVQGCRGKDDGQDENGHERANKQRNPATLRKQRNGIAAGILNLAADILGILHERRSSCLPRGALTYEQ